MRNNKTGFIAAGKALVIMLAIIGAVSLIDIGTAGRAITAMLLVLAVPVAFKVFAIYSADEWGRQSK